MIRALILRVLACGHDDVCTCPSPTCCRTRVVNLVLAYPALLGLALGVGQTWLCCGQPHRSVPGHVSNRYGGQEPRRTRNARRN